MRFLGMIGYYQCFCKNVSTGVAPLADWLKARAQFECSECQEAFCNVKSLFCSASVLAAPLVLQVDAIHVRAGDVLMQAVDRAVISFFFFLKKFNHYQLNYSVVEKKALDLI